MSRDVLYFVLAVNGQQPNFITPVLANIGMPASTRVDKESVLHLR
jgi:hypothetical protein